jgi:hypothetical protein
MIWFLNMPLSVFGAENDSIDWSTLDLTGSYYKKNFFSTGTKWTLGGVGALGAGAAAYFLLSGDNDEELNAQDDEVETPCNQDLTFNVLFNDSGKGVVLTGISNMPSGILYSFLPDGTIQIDEPGIVSFSFDYTIEDDEGNTASAQAFVSVVSPQFEVVNDVFSVRQNETLGSNLLDNDIGEGLSITGHSPVQGGQLFLIDNGDFTFSADAEACGEVIFEYTVTDVCQREATGSATITIIDEVPPEIQCPASFEIGCSDEPVPSVTGMPVATDNCDQELSVSYSDQIIDGICAGNDTIRRTWTVEDDQDNSASCVQIIEVTDEEPPVITCPPDIVVACDADYTPQSTGAATATDNCSAQGEITITYEDDESGLTGCGGTGVVNRTWRARDACGNVAECVQTIRFEDNTPPVITCPGNLVISCDNGLDPTITGEPSAVDNCTPGQQLAISYSDVITGVIDCSGFGTVTRTWTVSDLCGNSSTCVQSIEVQPIKGPLIVCPPDLTISCDESLDPSNTGNATATTDCDRAGEIEIRYEDNITGQTGCNGTGVLVRTWIATDPCGVSSTCRQLISVVDNEAPVINCPGNIEISCEESIDPSSTGMPEYSDNCTPVAQLQISHEDDLSGLGGCNNTGLLLRSWTVTDLCGLESACVQEINIVDDENPLIDCPADITISCDESTAPSSTGIAQASDNCSSGTALSIIYEDDLSGLDQCGGTGVILRTWIAEDACGFAVSCVQRITVADTQPPAMTCPADVIISCEESPDPQSTGIPGVTDNCSTGEEIALEYTDDLTGLTGCAGTGTMVCTWVATDACGNTVSCVQNIRIRDNSPPVLTCLPDVIVNCDESILPTNTGTPAVDDNCSVADIVLEYSDDMSGANGCNGTGTIVRTWTATDACGNSSVCTQSIAVVDNTAPVLVCPPNISITCDQETDPQNTGQATAADDCTPPSGISIAYTDAVSGAIDCSGNGRIRRTWTATDACGNASSCVQEIVVTQIDLPLIECPDDITISCEASVAPSNTGTATASTSCSIDGELVITYQDAPSLGGCNGTGFIARTWRVEDPCGLLNTCTQIITIEDTRAPVLVCPSDITIRCDASTDPAVTGIATVSDNCTATSNIDLSFSDVSTGPMDCSGVSEIVRTWRAEDLCGNVSFCVQNITIEPVEGPAIDCPPDVVIGCNESAAPSNTGQATATGICAIPGEIVISYADDVSGLTGCSGTGDIVRTWTATDPCGGSTSCVQTISVRDQTPPAITCPSDVTVGCNDDIAPQALGIATATDNCTGSQNIQISYSDDATGLTGCAGTGAIERTWTATDLCGNTSSCVQTITVSDNTPPALTCPSSITLRCDQPFDPSVAGSPAVSDNCSEAAEIVLAFSDVVDGPLDCSGVTQITRTWTATDACGNSRSCQQNIFLEPIDGPQISCPPEVVIGCNDDTSPTSTGFATATTTCAIPGEITIGYTDNVSTSGFCNGTIERTWRATDPCGNSSTCIQTIRIEDNTAPVLDCPGDIAISCSVNPVPANTGAASATDDCSSTADITITYQDDRSGFSTCGGTILRTWRATDECGNFTTCVQQITINDNAAPTLSCPPDANISCGQSSDPSNTGVATATDNCSSGVDLTVTYSDQLASTAQCGPNSLIIRTWTAEDACGNTTSCEQQIFITDAQAPVVACPGNITLDCSESTDPANAGRASAVDNCTAQDQIIITYSDDLSGLTGCNQTGLLLRTWTAEDLCGNTGTCVQNITIRDTQPPVIVCPAEITVRCDESLEPARTGFATATDNCTPSAGISLTYQDFREGASGCSGPATILRLWTARDACGNTADCFQTINVQPTPDPLITCPPDVVLACDDPVLPATTGVPVVDTDCSITGENVIDYTDNNTGLTGCNGTGTLVRTWTVTDPCGRSNSCTQNLVIEDETSPVLNLPAAGTVSCLSDLPPVYASYTAFTSAGGTASDNCGLNTSSFALVSEVSNGNTCPEIITRTYSIADQCGNSTTASHAFTIDDNTAPVLTAPPAASAVCAIDEQPAYATLAQFRAAGGIASDNCGLDEASFALASETVSGSCPVTVTRTYSISDNCGNTGSITHTITIDDTEAPVLTAPGNLSATCSITEIPAYTTLQQFLDAGGTASDNCGLSAGSFGLISQTSTGSCPQTVTRVYGVEDLCGNQATAQQTITIDDNILPSITVPSGGTFSCASELPAPYANPEELLAAGGTLSDNCAINAASLQLVSQVSNGSTCPEVITRTYRIRDLCGNSAQASQTFTIDDNESPVLVNVPADATVSCDAVPPATGVSATDNCTVSPTVSVNESSTAGACPNSYTLTRTWTATDACGNTATATQTLVVVDNDSPVLICPPDIAITCLQTPEPALTGTATATDACGGLVSIVYSDLVFGPNDCSGTTRLARTWTATDVCGNATSCVQSITIDPISGPQITCPTDVTIACDASTGPANTGAATATNPQCTVAGEMVITYDDDISNIGDCGGYILRTWMATDPCGLTAECTQRITLQDNTAPSFTNLPADVSISCDDVIPDVPTVTATDNCDDSPDITFVQTTLPGACAESYTIVRTWTATDACGNETEASQSIDVEDNVAPVLSEVPADISVSCDAIPVAPIVTATDNCDGAPEVSLDESRTPGGCDNEFVLTRTWTAVDNCGNSAQGSQDITVTDNTPPVITCPADVTATCDDVLSPDSLGYATATDLCTAAEDIVITYADNAQLDLCGGTGTIERTWTATDPCGNAVSCVQTITIVDNTGPDMTCPPDAFITCGQSGDPAITGTATATDNCSASGEITITYSDDSTGVFDCSGDGTVARTWTAEDACGNISTCVQTISVQQLVCPPDITISCEETTDPVNTGAALAETACATPGIKYTYEDDSSGVTGCGTTGTIVRTWTMRDSCSLEISCPQSIVVEDVTAPEIVCPDDIAITCADSTDPALLGTPKAQDNCSTSFVFTYEDDSVVFNGCEGLIERTWVVEDECGNTDTCVQLIKVVEEALPPSALAVEERSIKNERAGDDDRGITGILFGGIDYGLGGGVYTTFTIQSGSLWLHPSLHGSASDYRTTGLLASIQLRKNFGVRKIVPFAAAGVVWGMDEGQSMLSNDVLQTTHSFQSTGIAGTFSVQAWYVSGGLLWKLGSRFLYDLDIRLNTNPGNSEYRPMMIRPSLNSRFIYLIHGEGNGQ